MLTDPEASATTPIVAMLADPFLDAAPLSTDRIIEAMSEAAKAELRKLRFVVFIPTSRQRWPPRNAVFLNDDILSV